MPHPLLPLLMVILVGVVGAELPLPLYWTLVDMVPVPLPSSLGSVMLIPLQTPVFPGIKWTVTLLVLVVVVVQEARLGEGVQLIMVVVLVQLGVRMDQPQMEEEGVALGVPHPLLVALG